MTTTPSKREGAMDVLSAGDAANSVRHYFVTLFVTSNSLGITGNTKRDGWSASR